MHRAPVHGKNIFALGDSLAELAKIARESCRGSHEATGQLVREGCIRRCGRDEEVPTPVP
jgi:hypothetical protein